jgi:hypothetical protein
MTEFWPTDPVAAITIEEQERFVRHLRERGLVNGTIKRMAGVLGAALRRAYNTNQLAAVPAVLKPTYFGPDVERQRILTLDEMKVLWEAKMPFHLRVYLVISINTAARPEAILELKSEQIDLERRLLRLNPPGRRQTKKYRPTLPISNTLLPWLDLERDYQVQYKKRQDRPIDSIKTTWREVRKRAGRPRPGRRSVHDQAHDGHRATPPRGSGMGVPRVHGAPLGRRYGALREVSAWPLGRRGKGDRRVLRRAPRDSSDPNRPRTTRSYTPAKPARYAPLGTRCAPVGREPLLSY